MADYADKLMAALKEAMKAKDNERRNTIRLLQAEFKQFAVDEQRDPNSDEELKILMKEAKKRRESIAELEGAGRGDQAESEKAELVIIEGFLPQMMSRAEIATIAQRVIEETGAASMKDMGKVMGKVMAETKGQADGSDVSAVVKELLSN